MSMAERNQRREELRRVFSLFDAARSGTVKTEELALLLRSVGLGGGNLGEDVIASMKHAMDPQHTGRIAFDVFDQIVSPCLVSTGSFEEMWMVFRLFDRNKTGWVCFEDLAEVANVENCGLLSDRQCQAIVRMLKSEGSTKPGITFDEWKAAVTSQLAVDAEAEAAEEAAREADDTNFASDNFGSGDYASGNYDLC
jgi:Ca2+-binding EF-hand superfamily protein